MANARRGSGRNRPRITHRWIGTCLLGWCAVAAPCPAITPVPHPNSDADSLRYAEFELLDRSASEAEAIAAAVLQRLERTGRGLTPMTADALDVLVRARLAGGRGAEPSTLAWAERALKLRQELQTPRELAAASTLIATGESLASQRRYDEAEELMKRALSLREKEWGPGHALVADALEHYARFLHTKAHEGGVDYVSDDALLSVVASVVGGVVSEKIEKGSGDQFAMDYLSQHVEEPEVCRELRTAQRAAERALAIRNALPEDEDDSAAESYLTLARLARDGGDFQEARAHLESARKLLALRSEHKALAVDVEIGEVLHDAMDPARARLLLERTVASLRAGVPDSSLEFRARLALARVYEALSDSAGTASALAAANGLRHGLGQADWKRVVEAARFASDQLRRSGARREAETLLERSLQTAEREGGERHPIVADVAMDLGTLHLSRNDPKRAKKWFARAAEVREAAFGGLHPLVAEAWLEKAACHELLDEEGGAKDSWERAIRILDKCVGPSHPTTALARQRLSLLYRLHIGGFIFKDKTNPGLALEFALAGHQAWRRHLVETVRYLPESEALSVASRPSLGLDVALDLLGTKVLAVRHLGNARRTWDELIRSRSLVLDEIARRQERIDGDEDSSTTNLRSELREQRQRLAELLVGGAGSFSFRRYVDRIEAAREEVARLERALFARTADRSGPLRSDIGLAEVQRSLPHQSALLSYVRYRHFEKKGSQEHYLALLCKTEGSPDFVRLGPARAIDDAVAVWREEASQGALRPGRVGAEEAYRAAGERLRALIWDPVQGALNHPERLFIVPDGALHLVNWAALPTSDGGYLVENAPLLHYLNTERDLATWPDRRMGRPPVLFGGPDYDHAESGRLDAMLATATARTAYNGLRAACGDFESIRFQPLPGTSLEVDAIARLIRSASARGDTSSLPAPRTFTGARASEEAFKASAGKAGILHVATHGFFLGGSCASSPDRQRAIGALQFEEPLAPPTASVNPLRLSGLALAGANRRQTTAPGVEDGILTAEEIACLDLRGVGWAVLSACDTGVGDVRTGEGVFGLRRALQIAGAGTLVMSLWSVDDEASRDWMQRLYEARFQRGRATAEAAREATLGLLAERRARGLSTHPFYWAGFVAVGDWR